MTRRPWRHQHEHQGQLGNEEKTLIGQLCNVNSSTWIHGSVDYARHRHRRASALDCMGGGHAGRGIDGAGAMGRGRSVMSSVSHMGFKTRRYTRLLVFAKYTAHPWTNRSGLPRHIAPLPSSSVCPQLSVPSRHHRHRHCRTAPVLPSHSIPYSAAVRTTASCQLPPLHSTRVGPRPQVSPSVARAAIRLAWQPQSLHLQSSRSQSNPLQDQPGKLARFKTRRRRQAIKRPPTLQIPSSFRQRQRQKLPASRLSSRLVSSLVYSSHRCVLLSPSSLPQHLTPSRPRVSKLRPSLLALPKPPHPRRRAGSSSNFNQTTLLLLLLPLRPSIATYSPWPLPRPSL